MAKLLANDGVAFARCPFQPEAICNRHHPFLVTNQSRLLERGYCQLDVRPTHAQHLRQELQGDREGRIACLVVRHQKPAGATFVHVVGTLQAAD